MIRMIKFHNKNNPKDFPNPDIWILCGFLPIFQGPVKPFSGGMKKKKKTVGYYRNARRAQLYIYFISGAQQPIPRKSLFRLLSGRRALAESRVVKRKLNGLAGVPYSSLAGSQSIRWQKERPPAHTLRAQHQEFVDCLNSNITLVLLLAIAPAAAVVVGALFSDFEKEFNYLCVWRYRRWKRKAVGARKFARYFGAWISSKEAIN